MTVPNIEGPKYFRINTPSTLEEWQRVHTLLKLSLGIARRVRAEEKGAEGEASDDASDE